MTSGEFQRMRYRVRCQMPAAARLVANVHGKQYATPIGPGVSQAHVRRMAEQRACRGCPNAHACQYGAICRWPA